MEPPPTVSSVSFFVPTFNEERHIKACIHNLYQQTGCNILEVLVIDGGSQDETAFIVEQLRSSYANLRLLHNPHRSQSAAVNIAAANADQRATMFVRFDAHSKYAPDFAQRCIQALEETGATSAVVSMVTVGHHGFQRAVAAACNSCIGNGGALHRRSGQRSGFIDHGHHAAFDLDFFIRIGGYDEAQAQNEDFEYDIRTWQNGGKVWFAADARMDYFPRTTCEALARQYFGYGRGRAKSHLKHRLPPRLRQLVPLIIFLVVLAGVVLLPLTWIFTIPAVLYVAACLCFGALLAVRLRDPWVFLSGIAAVIMHLSYGAGVVMALLGFARHRVLLRRQRQGRWI